MTARNVPIDKDLLAALPPERRKWVEKIGLGGTIDIDGRVWREHAEQMQHAFDVTLRNGTIWPNGGTLAAEHVTGKLHLTPDQAVLSDYRLAVEQLEARLETVNAALAAL